MIVRTIAIVATAAVSLVVGSSVRAAEPVTDTYREAATALFTYLRTAENLARLRGTMVEREVAADKRWKEFGSDLAAHLDKHMSWETVREHIIVGYAEIFTEDDLKAILAFYQSSAGVKVLNDLERANQAGFFEGVKAARTNMEELRFKVLVEGQKNAAERKKAQAGVPRVTAAPATQ
jgi:hypothetical protein